MNNKSEFLKSPNSLGLKPPESMWNGFPVTPDDELNAKSELRYQMSKMPELDYKAVKSVLGGSPLGENIVRADSAMKSVFRPAPVRLSRLSLGSPFGGGGFDPFR